jgi:hypothetical protein
MNQDRDQNIAKDFAAKYADETCPYSSNTKNYATAIVP